MNQNMLQVTLTNQPHEDTDVIHEDYDPMLEDFQNPELNRYVHGPGADLDSNLSRPAYMNKDKQVVFKIMVRRIPRYLTENGLRNLLMNFGRPTINKCFMKAPNQLDWALIEFSTLQEALNAIRALDSADPYQMKVSFARSDMENERRKRIEKENERIHQEYSMMNKSDNPDTVLTPNPVPRACDQSFLRLLGRGQNRGRIIINACRQYCERSPGSRNVTWSNGTCDLRDPGGLIYRPSQYEVSNRYLQNLSITSGANSVREVSLGCSFIPPESRKGASYTLGTNTLRSMGEDIYVPLLLCRKCDSETTQKCSKCGTPYCSRQCQREDFARHLSECKKKECIDTVVNANMQQSQRFVPLSRHVDPDQLLKSFPTHQMDRLWGKPKDVINCLEDGVKISITINSGQCPKYHGAVCCAELFDVMGKLMHDLPRTLNEVQQSVAYWPTVGELVAVRYDDSIWRGYILNAPILGSSTTFTVAFCDLAIVKSVEVANILRLPLDYHNVPELAVSLDFLSPAPELKNECSITVRISKLSESKATAQVLSDDGNVLGMLVISPWQPVFENELNPIQLTSPCNVILSAYHHQHAIYVRPVGDVYRNHMFNILQKVAAHVVTSPPLDRAPYKGEMVACKFKKDGNFYRGIVQDMKSNEYLVFFVDIGNLDTASSEEMKALPVDLKMSPCMAVKVSLKGVKQGPLTERAIMRLNMILQKETQLRLECRKPNLSEGVELFLPGNESLNSEINEALMMDWQTAMKEGGQPHDCAVFMLDQLEVLPLIKNGLKSGFITVFILQVISDGRIAMCPVDRPEVEHVYQTLSFQMNEYCESMNQSPGYNPRVEEVCLVKYKDGVWYRAVNMKTIVETQSCRVLFLDFGNEEEVMFKDIRRIVRDFVNAPTIVSLCQIDGIQIPEVPEDARRMIQRIGELLAPSKVREIQVLDKLSKGEYKISIPEISNLLKVEFPQ